MKIGIFGGQGTEYKNMGLDFIEKYPLAQKIYEQTTKLSKDNFSIKNILTNDEDKIRQTQYAQPLILMFNHIVSSCLKLYKGIQFDTVFGLSLGEYSALVYSKAIEYEECFKLILKRAELMQKCCESISTGIAAILVSSEQALDNLINSGFKNKIFKSNFNSSNQIVVGGTTDNLNLFIQHLKENKVRAIKLKVSGAFHTPFMKKAENQIDVFLKNINWKKTNIKVLANLTGDYYLEEPDYVNILSKQITHPVLLSKIIGKVCEENNVYYEIGPKKIISKLLTSNCKNATENIKYIGTLNEMEEI